LIRRPLGDLVSASGDVLDEDDAVLAIGDLCCAVDVTACLSVPSSLTIAQRAVAGAPAAPVGPVGPVAPETPVAFQLSGFS
jgi:hypothetical protein